MVDKRKPRKIRMRRKPGSTSKQTNTCTRELALNKWKYTDWYNMLNPNLYRK